jgi:hypothetical protein
VPAHFRCSAITGIVRRQESVVLFDVVIAFALATQHACRRTKATVNCVMEIQTACDTRPYADVLQGLHAEALLFGTRKTTRRHNVAMSDVIHRSGSSPLCNPCQRSVRAGLGVARISTLVGDRKSVWGSRKERPSGPCLDVILSLSLAVSHWDLHADSNGNCVHGPLPDVPSSSTIPYHIDVICVISRLQFFFTLRGHHLSGPFRSSIAILYPAQSRFFYRRFMQGPLSISRKQ